MNENQKQTVSDIYQVYEWYRQFHKFAHPSFEIAQQGLLMIQTINYRLEHGISIADFATKDFGPWSRITFFMYIDAQYLPGTPAQESLIAPMKVFEKDWIRFFTEEYHYPEGLLRDNGFNEAIKLLSIKKV